VTRVPARKVLVVTYPYPPMPTVGGNRWLAMSKYLRRFGHEVSILTTSAFGSLPDDAERDVIRSGDLIAAPWLRGLLRRPPLPKPGQPAEVDKAPPGIITRIIVPDPYLLTWVPGAVRGARRLQRERGFDCVVTTSAYESAHVIPLAMGGRRPAWIADFRDGWTYHPWKPPYPTALQTDLDRALERKVVRTAERTTVVQRAVGDDFRARLGLDAAYVPNGWDPDLEREAEASQTPPLPEGRMLLVHTGRLSGAWGRHPANLLEALRRLVERDPAARGCIALVLAGRLDRDEQELIARSGLDDVVFHVGHLSRGQAMGLQRRADALLLITSSEVAWELPGKLFEYLGADRPILALAESNEAARVVRETRTGLTVSPDDVEAIERALAGALAGEVAEAHRPRGLERYLYPSPARAMEEQIEVAISARPR
jgi:glycosyltransferase involved in cell wall biosynthesis